MVVHSLKLVFHDKLFQAGALLSGPFAGYLMFRLGRRKAIIIHAILLTIGWALIPLANSVMNNNAAAVSLLYLGRFMTGNFTFVYLNSRNLKFPHIKKSVLCVLHKGSREQDASP